MAVTLFFPIRSCERPDGLPMHGASVARRGRESEGNSPTSTRWSLAYRMQSGRGLMATAVDWLLLWICGVPARPPCSDGIEVGVLCYESRFNEVEEVGT